LCWLQSSLNGVAKTFLRFKFEEISPLRDLIK
jgi:hypothetical protein